MILLAVILTLYTPAHRWPPRQELARCFVYLPAMRDVRLRRWCLKQSERMP
jgi:hypothetical protein